MTGDAPSLEVIASGEGAVALGARASVARVVQYALLAVLATLVYLLAPDRPVAQEVGARLKEAGVYTETPIRGQPFYALKQQSLSPSDRRATIYTEWLLPQPGHYTVRYHIYGPSGSLYLANTHPFDAAKEIWPTWFTFALPTGEKAKAMAGRWKAEVFLNADRLATLSFELLDRDRRIETDASIAVFPFVVEDESKDAAAGVAAERAEELKASASYLSSELQRLFPRVIPPQQSRTLLGEELTPVDAEKPASRFRVRQRLGADVAIAGRVTVPAAGTAKANLEVTVVNLATGLTERFRAALSEGRGGISSRDLMEELTVALLVQESFLTSLRAQTGQPPKAALPAVGGPPPSLMPAEPKGVKGIPEIVKEQADAVVFLRVTAKSGERRVGTGFVVRQTGEILTNLHLVEDAKTVTVKLKNEDVYDEVVLLESDPRRDIALIKVRGWNLPVVRLGNSDPVQVGERVVAIGNPRGLEQTVTDGLISAIRDTGKGYKLFQMSVPISTGSSGGPLFNMAGEAIGITAAYLEGGQNLNFAIPINYGLALLQGSTPPATGSLSVPQGGPSGVTR
jgi:S1-C subfamily serine protease